MAIIKPNNNTISASFKTYRQDLRDITENVTTVDHVNAITWSTKP